MAAQSTTSHLVVSLNPPRPSVSFTSTAACSPSAFSVATACIATPICVHSPETLVGTSVTFDIYGLPVYVCTNATYGTVTSTRASSTSGAGIVTASLPHTSLPSSSGTTTTSSGTGTSAAAASQSSNPASKNVGLSSGLLTVAVLAWLGIAVFNPRNL